MELQKIEQCFITRISWKEKTTQNARGVLQSLKVRCNNQKTMNDVADDRYISFSDSQNIKGIVVSHDGVRVSALQIIKKYNQIDQIGNPDGPGGQGDLVNEFVGVRPGEKLCGIRIQEYNLKDDEDETAIQKIGFVFVGKSQ